MKGKWKRFGAFVVAAACVIAAVSIGTRGENQGALQVLARIGLVGVIVYLTTFVVWPRHLMAARFNRPTLEPGVQRPAPAPAPVSAPLVDVLARSAQPELEPKRPVAEERRGLKPQSHPAGSRASKGQHRAEAPPARNSRGRRVESRQSSERDFRWPARP